MPIKCSADIQHNHCWGIALPFLAMLSGSTVALKRELVQALLLHWI